MVETNAGILPYGTTGGKSADNAGAAMPSASRVTAASKDFFIIFSLALVRFIEAEALKRSRATASGDLTGPGNIPDSSGDAVSEMQHLQSISWRKQKGRRTPAFC
jgi:hypothetical protein